MFSRFILCTLLGVSFLLASAQDRYQEANDLPDNTNTTLRYSEDEALSILSAGVAIDGKYRRIYRKCDRWKKKAIQRLEQSNSKLQAYQDQAQRWSSEIAYTLAQDKPKTTGALSEKALRDHNEDLFQYMKDMEAHHKWLISQWKQSVKPPIGDRIAYTESRLHALLTIKAELTEKPQDSPSELTQIKDINNHISSLLSYLKSVYKHIVPVAIDGSSMYEILELAHSIYPEFKSGKPQKNSGQKARLARAQFAQFIGQTVQEMNTAYFKAIAIARKANAASVSILSGQSNQENIEKLRALQADQKHFMQLFRTKYYSQRPPRVEYAQR